MDDAVRERLDQIDGLASHQLEVLVDSDLVLTGATGFVGKWLIGFWLHSIERFGGQGRILLVSRNPKRILETFPELHRNARVEFISSDIRNLEIPQTYEGCTVIHGATAASEALNLLDPFEMIDVIVEGTRRTVLECNRVRARKLVFLSSGAVYGFAKVGARPFSEEDVSGPNVSNPLNAYHEAKRLAELIVSVGREKFGLETVVLRLFTFFGQFLPVDIHFAVGSFVRQAVDDKTIRIKSGGSSVRSYQHGAELARDIFFCTTHAMNHVTYNIGSPNPITVLGLANTVAEVVGGGIQIEIEGRDTAESASSYVPSMLRFDQECEFRNSVGLYEGISEMISFYRRTRTC